MWSAGGSALIAYDRRRHLAVSRGKIFCTLVMLLCYCVSILLKRSTQIKPNRCFIRNKTVLSLNVIASIKVQQSPVSKLQSHRSQVEQFYVQWFQTTVRENRSIILSHLNLIMRLRTHGCSHEQTQFCPPCVATGSCALHLELDQWLRKCGAQMAHLSQVLQVLLAPNQM